MESNVKNVNKDIIGVILVGIVLIMGVYIFTSLADIGGTTEYFSSSENSTMNTSSVFIAPVSDGVSSFSAQTYNQTWLRCGVGTNDRVYKTSMTNPLINNTLNSTIVFNFIPYNSSSYHGIIYYGSGTSNIFDFYLNYPSMNFKIQYKNNTGTTSYITFTDSPVLNQKNNIILTWNNSNLMIFINGVYKQNYTFSMNESYSNSITLCQMSDSSKDGNMSIFDFSVFNGTIDKYDAKDIYYSGDNHIKNYTITKTSTNNTQYSRLWYDTSTGYVYGYGTGSSIYKSNDNFMTQTLVYNRSLNAPLSTGSRFIWQSSRGDFYTSLSSTGNISVSLGNDTNWKTVKIWVNDNSTGKGYADGWRMTEDDLGNLYANEYGGSSDDNISYIHKSTDRGLTWTVTMNSSDYNWQSLHTHIVKFNPYNKCLYATMGDNVPRARLIRSCDYGATWESLQNGSGDHQYTNIEFTPNYNLFFTDSLPNKIYRTSDDITFNQIWIAPSGWNGYSWETSQDDNGNIYYGYVTSDSGTTYALIMSPDEGDSWFVLEKNVISPNSYYGYWTITNFDSNGYAYMTDTGRAMSYKFKLNDFTYWNNYLLSWGFDENSGTTAYDSSGNGNNGTISGATWQNDGVLVSLTEDTDYSISNNGLLSLLNSNYLYSYIVKYWTYFTESTNPGTVASLVMVDSLGNSTTFLSILIVISFAVVILTLFKPSVNTNPLGKPHY